MTEILQSFHDDSSSGVNNDYYKICYKISKRLVWKGLSKDVKHYTNTYEICQKVIF